jgi:chemosensory pili system protein ChpC
MIRQLIDVNKAVDLITMLLPVAGKNLLLPNVAVAEIIQLGDLATAGDNSAGVVGTCCWRGRRIPVLDFELMNQQRSSAADFGFNAAVINGAAQGLPFYAIATKSPPRMMRINHNEIIENADASHGPAELMIVDACGETATIPDLEYIEGRLLEVVGPEQAAVAQVS